MTEKEQIDKLVEQDAQLCDELDNLEIENLYLRGAAEHFLYCRSCDADDFSYCDIGREYVERLGFLSADE